MDGTTLGFFLLATFIGGLASGLSGFAMGVVVTSIWLHILTPMQAATLLVGYGVLTQGYAIWKLRHALRWRRVAPFIAGGALGVPIGALLLASINPAHVRTGVGVLLVLYSLYNLAQPVFKPVQAGVPADVAVGALNGLLGGMTGLTGILVTIWCQLRGWQKDVQRTVFQPVNLAAIILSLISLAVAGGVTAGTVRLYLLGLPALLAGLWSGFRLYGKLDERVFRKVMLYLLLLAGVALIVPASGLR